MSRLATATDALRRDLRRFAIAIGALNVLLPLGLILYATWVGDDYWEYFWGEHNAITWYSSVQLLLVGAVAAANGSLLALLQRLGGDGGGRTRLLWWIFAAGFVFLALDEQFEIHESLRDDVLKPANAFYGISFIRPGDIALYAYLAVGAVLALFLLHELRRVRFALPLFLSGVVLAAATTVIDAVPREVEAQLHYFWTSVFEESGELWAQLLFGLAFGCVLDTRLAELARTELAEP